MPASNHSKILSVRLPEEDLRRFKSLAATRGISVQDAVYQALEAWGRSTPTPPSDSLSELQGLLADTDVDQLRREDRDLELARERRLLND